MKRKILLIVAFILASSHASAASVLVGNGIAWTYDMEGAGTTSGTITLHAAATLEGASFGWGDEGWLAGIGIKNLGDPDNIPFEINTVTFVDMLGKSWTGNMNELNSAAAACEKGGSSATRGCAFANAMGDRVSSSGPLEIILGITSDGPLTDNGFHFKVRWENAAGTKTGSLISDDFTPVPLPAAAWLFASALVGLVAVGRRKRDLGQRRDMRVA
jgi:hypothetical protein